MIDGLPYGLDLTAFLLEQMKQQRVEKFAELASNLSRGWDDLQRRRRVVVHVPSISRDEAQRMSMDYFAIEENSQMGRLLWAGSPDVEVIYVAPFPLSPDVLQYYTKLLQVHTHSCLQK